MKVLVVTKPTNFEQLGEQVAAAAATTSNREQIEELKLAHADHYRTLAKVRASLTSHGIAFKEIIRNTAIPKDGPFDGIITVGGDGTLLSASHFVNDKTPVVGIRSSGTSVGYLCAGGEDDVERLIAGFQQKTLKYIRCARLRASIYFLRGQVERQTVPVLNDILFTNANPCATTRYSLRFDHKLEAHKSSGVWISTATGSTAGIYAAGGQKCDRSEKRFQFRVRELYKVNDMHFDLAGGFFDPDVETLTIENFSDSAVLALDGLREVIPLQFGDRFTILRAEPMQTAIALSQ